MLGALGRIITEYQDRQRYRPSLAAIGRAMRPPVERSVVHKWAHGSAPEPANLRALARVLHDVPYLHLCVAVLVDLGYLSEEEAIEQAPMN